MYKNRFQDVADIVKDVNNFRNSLGEVADIMIPRGSDYVVLAKPKKLAGGWIGTYVDRFDTNPNLDDETDELAVYREYPLFFEFNYQRGVVRIHDIYNTFCYMAKFGDPILSHKITDLKECAMFDLEDMLISVWNRSNPIININAPCGIFIIPNSAPLIKDFCWGQDKSLMMANELCELNMARPFNPETDHLVEVWSYVQGGWENMQDHLHEINLDNGHAISTRVVDRYIPEQILEGWKEGEIRSLKLHLTDGFILCMTNVETTQTKTRYRHCGNFEDAMALVTGRSTQ